jgi:hypothetical protein
VFSLYLNSHTTPKPGHSEAVLVGIQRGASTSVVIRNLREFIDLAVKEKLALSRFTSGLKAQEIKGPSY